MAERAAGWRRLTEQRISRRRALAGLAAAAGGAMLVACGRSGPRGAATSTPRAGGTLRIATALPVEYGLDPHVERGAGLGIFPRIYGYTHHVDFENGDAIVLDHAATVEQPDATTTLIRLRPDVRFQDVAPVSGRVVTAHDVAASVLRYRDSKLVTDRLWHAQVLDRIEAPDASTVRVITRRPYVYSIQQLGDLSAGAIIPRELVESSADLRTSGIGSGPFTIDSADPDARTWRIARNPQYLRAPLPYLDAMEWRVYDDDPAKLAALSAGEADQADNRDRPESIAAAGAGRSHVVIDGHKSLAWLSLGLRTDRPPFIDPRVRQALDIAIDRDALIRAMAPDAGVVLGPVNPHLAQGFWSLPESDVRAAFAAPADSGTRFDAAKQLLEAASATSAPFTIQTVNTPRMIDVASAIRQQLLAVGLDARIDELDELTWFANFRTGAFDATVISHAPYETPDMPTRLYHSGGIDGSGNEFGLRDPDLDALIERSWGEDDRIARRDTLIEAQRAMLASRADLQLFTSTGYVASWDRVHNRHPELLGSFVQYNYEQWLDA